MADMRRLLMVLASTAALAACSSGLSDQDRALLNSSNQNAEAAKQQSAQALDAARSAQASANAANEKADRMFDRSTRK